MKMKNPNSHSLRLRASSMIVILAFTLLAAASVHAQRPNSAWGTIPSPNAGAGPNELFGVDVLAANDIWAVGNFGDFVSPGPQVQHWDGVSWRVVATPEGVDGDLIGVSALAANDVWFVGGAAHTGETFIYHWDGTSVNRVASPSPGSFNRLYAVVALAANNVWAVGETANGVSTTLIQHWDGTKWSVVPSPTSVGEYTQLFGVAAVSANDIWAVGKAGSDTYTLHWDGTSWNFVATPKVSGSGFKAVSATSAGVVWAVGQKSGGTLTERWTGQTWEVVASPAPGGFSNDLNGVVVLAANDIWAAGTYDQAGKFKTLALHWDGTVWTQVASDSPDPSYNAFNAVSADSQNTIWAVGRGEGTLAARWTGTVFDAVASANAGTGSNELKSISAVNASDIWAVGIADGDSLTEHWDGTSWTVVPVPDFPLDAPLEGVTAIASNDVWAVGFQADPATSDSSNVIIHWNGTAWISVPSPNPGGRSLDRLHDVKAVGPNDIWAVGEYLDRQGQPLGTILHWNGSVWSVVPNNCGPLFGITVISATDIWAVGYTSCHYDGSTWTAIPIPPTNGGITLQDVSAVSTNDVWAVGVSVYCDGFTCYFSSYAIHWNGTKWLLTKPIGISLSGVQTLGPNDVYAVGTNSVGTLIEHWNGKNWRVVPSPDPGGGGALNEITSTPGKLWAVGSFFDENNLRTLVEDSPSATQGTVTGDTDVSDAVITWIGPVTGTTVTNSTGDYAAAGLPAGTYTFIASAGGCDPAIATVKVIAGKTVRANLDINCSP